MVSRSVNSLFYYIVFFTISYLHQQGGCHPILSWIITVAEIIGNNTNAPERVNHVFLGEFGSAK